MYKDIEKYKNPLLVLLLLFITFIVFSNSLYNDFTNWDDDLLIFKNKFVLEFQKEGISAFFTPSVLWRDPLTLFSQAVTYYFFSMNPFPYHLINLLLHLLNVALVYIFISKLTKNTLTAFFTGILFAVHPFKAESVSWIAERKDVLYAFFLLCSLISYLYYIHKEKNWAFLLSIFLAILSFFSKSAAVVYPFIILLLEYYHGRLFKKKYFAKQTGVLLLFVLMGFIYVQPYFTEKFLPFLKQVADTRGDYYVNYFNYTFIDKFLMGCYALVFYLYSVIAPIYQCIIVPYPFKIDGFLQTEYYVMPVILFFLLIGIILILRKKFTLKKEIIFGLLFFLTSISLVLHIIPMGGLSVAAERYTYIPYIGLFFIIGTLLTQLIKLRFFNKVYIKYLFIFFFPAIILVYSYKVYSRNKVWTNSITLFNDVIKQNPKLAVGYINRGIAKYDLKDFKGAMEDMDIAISLVPNTPDVWYNRACIKYGLEDYKGAIFDYTRTIDIKRTYINAYLNRGLSYLKLNDTIPAKKDLFKTLDYDPKNPFAIFNLGRIYLNQGMKDTALYYFSSLDKMKIVDPYIYYYRSHCINSTDEKINDLSKAIDIFPGLSNAWYERGLLKLDLKDYYGALADLSESIELQIKQVAKTSFIFKDNKEMPVDNNVINLNISENRAFMFYNRGRINILLGKKKEAIEDFTTSLKLNSVNYDTYLQRGNSRLDIKDINNAIEDFRKVIMLNPNKAEAYFGLGNASFLKKELDSALIYYNKALELTKEPNAKLYSNKGNVKFAQKDFNGAVKEYDMAIKIDGQNPDFFFNRALAKYNLNKTADACKDLKKADELGSPKAKQALNKICN